MYEGGGGQDFFQSALKSVVGWTEIYLKYTNMWMVIFGEGGHPF